jgi:hypothetical protein
MERASKKRTSAAIKRLFGEAGKAQTQRDAGPKPAPRRRRGGDTVASVFATAARAVVRRVAWLLPEGHAAVFLSDTLDWLNLWHHDEAGSVLDDEVHDTPPNHLFPHL